MAKRLSHKVKSRRSAKPICLCGGTSLHIIAEPFILYNANPEQWEDTAM